MKPEEFRTLLIEPGTSISLVSGDYGGLEWEYNNRIQGFLKSYIIVENHPSHDDHPKDINWDTAAILALNDSLEVVETSSNYLINELLLIHRYPDSPWDNNDQTVWVFGIKSNLFFERGPVDFNIWQENTILLSYGAFLLIENSLRPSDMVLAYQRNEELKNLKSMLNLGQITKDEFENKITEIDIKYSQQ